MKFFGYWFVETKRIFHDKITWIIILLAVVSPMAGYSLYKPLNVLTKSSIYIANPALVGATIGTILFALFTIYELDYIKRVKISEITDSIVSSVTMYIVRILSILSVAIITGLIMTIAYLPYTAYKVGYFFKFSLFIECYWLITIPAYLIAIIVSAFLYQITRKITLSLILYSLFLYLSMNYILSEGYILRWINPILPILSDNFTNTYTIRMILYNRIFWMFNMLSLWTLSVLFIRKHGHSFKKYIIKDLRLLPIPLLIFCFLIISLRIYQKEPFIDHSPKKFNYINDSPFDSLYGISVNSVHISIEPNTKTGIQHGTETIIISNNSGREQKCSVQVNPGYKITSITANKKPLSYVDLNNDRYNYKRVEFYIPSEVNIELDIHYGGFPRLWSVVELYPDNIEISDDYINLIASDLAPIFFWPILYQEFPYIVDLTIPSNLFPVINGGKSELLRESADGTKTWRFTAKLNTLFFFAADYEVLDITADNIPIELYYSAGNKDFTKISNIGEKIKDIFNYCYKHYGTPLFISFNRPFKIVETPSYSNSNSNYITFELMTMNETYLNKNNFNSSFHNELQQDNMYFSITNYWWNFSGRIAEESEWSGNGLALYTAYRIAKEEYGDEYVNKNYVEIWQKNVDDYFNCFYYRNPEYLDHLPKKFKDEFKNKTNFILKYNLMPLKLIKAEELVGGEKKFDDILHKIFQKTLYSLADYITYDDFLYFCNLSAEDLNIK